MVLVEGDVGDALELGDGYSLGFGVSVGAEHGGHEQQRDRQQAREHQIEQATEATTPTRSVEPALRRILQRVGGSDELVTQVLEVRGERFVAAHQIAPWNRCCRVRSARDTRIRAFCSVVPIRAAASG